MEIPFIHSGGVDISYVTATADKILLNYIGVDSEGEPLTGTMPDIGNADAFTNLSFANSTLYVGMHNGAHVTNASSGYPEVLVPGSQLGDAEVAQVLNGKKFTSSNGLNLTGTMPNIGKQTNTTTYGGSVTISQGYHDGTGSITGGAFSFGGNAGTGDVLSGKTFYNNASSIRTGTMANQGSLSASIAPTASYSLSAGYYSGGTVSNKTIQMTQGTANITSATHYFNTPNGNANIACASFSSSHKVLYLCATTIGFSQFVVASFVSGSVYYYWYDGSTRKGGVYTTASQYASSYSSSNKYATGTFYLPNLYGAAGSGRDGYQYVIIYYD